jgi:hypothetical protein
MPGPDSESENRFPRPLRKGTSARRKLQIFADYFHRKLVLRLLNGWSGGLRRHSDEEKGEN